MYKGNRWVIPTGQTDILEGLFVAGREALNGEDVLDASAVAIILLDVLPSEKVWVETTENGIGVIVMAWHDYILRFPNFVVSRKTLAELLNVKPNAPIGEMRWASTEGPSPLSPKSEELLRLFYVTSDYSVRG